MGLVKKPSCRVRGWRAQASRVATFTVNNASGSGSGVPDTTWEGKEDPNGPGSLCRVLRTFFKASQSSGTIPDGDKAIQKKKKNRDQDCIMVLTKGLREDWLIPCVCSQSSFDY